MAKVLRENNTAVARKTKPMKKTVKVPKQIELGEINQIMMLSQLIDNLEKKCLEHGLEEQLAHLRKTFKPSKLT